MLSLALLLGALALVDRLVLARSALPPRARLLHALAILSLSLAAMALAPAGPALGKCLGRLAMPLGLLWLLSLVAATITTRRATIRAAAGLWAVAGLIASIANPYLGAAALHSLEAPYDAQRPLEEEPFEAVIVLGGGV
ncbi:MAG: hypothetical protein OEY14_14260, partial [Myxococcales bacterium]|nr:hypothetical protein [Myxococcales bacterium]